MSPLIQVSDEVYRKLKEKAKSPKDTPSHVIASLLGIKEDIQDTPQDKTIEESPVPEISIKDSQFDETLKIDPEAPEDLYFTTIIQGHFGNRPVSTWNELIDTAHIVAVEKVETYDAVKKISDSDIVMGSYSENGFRPIPSIGISIQGDSPNLAWRNALHIAKKLNVLVEIVFEWDKKFTAARPGSKGVLAWVP
jgi:predicted CopG family antitoxin